MAQKDEKEKKFGHCIICHQDCVEMSDEHVIPDAIGGYIHCYKVCKNCNSHLGDNVDIHLLNHYLIKCARHIHKLKGKAKFIPNPLIGCGMLLNTGKKVRVVDKEGVLTPQILPQSPKIADDNKSGHMIVDINDEKLIPAIQQKILKKMGMKPGGVAIECRRDVHKIENPVVQMQVNVDLKKYKIALLKIAYECCVELFPEYENDALSQKYAKILYDVAMKVDGAFDHLDEVKFVGDAFQDPLKHLLSQFIDYSNKNRHIIVYFNHDGHLCCLVKVFDIFSQFIEMSDSAYLKDGDIRLYINDFFKHNYEQLTLKDLIAKYSEVKPTVYKFDEHDMELITSLQQRENVAFYANKYGENLIYNKKGIVIMTEETLKDTMAEDRANDSSLSGNEFTITYYIPNGFYFKVSPTNTLVQLKELTETAIIHKY